MSTTTLPNKGLIQVTVGSEQDTWGPYVDTNFTILDNALGGTATVALTSNNVTLSSAQYQNVFLTFTGALNANVSITFPPVGSFYSIRNLTTNTSAFQVTLTTSISSGTHIGLPWGEIVDIMTDGVNVNFRNLDKIGTYLQLASSTVPAWIAACSVPPYLLCDGSSFSNVTYPILSAMIGTNVPDCRGRTKFSLDDGVGRISSLGGFLVGSGADTVTMGLIPPLQQPWQAGPQILQQAAFQGTLSGLQAVTAQFPSPIDTTPPAIMAGITLIRAA